jgi:MFS family permease
VLLRLIAGAARAGSMALFVGAICVALSMYGGGFATVPAYLADLFGIRVVGAIHGRLLTAWSTAGVLGPVLVNYIRDYQLDHGVARAEAYSVTMYILAGLLALGLVCNLAVRPVAERLFLDPQPQGVAVPALQLSAAGSVERPRTSLTLLVAAWAAVLVPVCWGVAVTLHKAAVLFQ